MSAEQVVETRTRADLENAVVRLEVGLTRLRDPFASDLQMQAGASPSSAVAGRT